MSLQTINLDITNLKYVSICDLCRFMPPVDNDDESASAASTSAVRAAIGFHLPEVNLDALHEGETLSAYVVRVAKEHSLLPLLLNHQTEQICQALLIGRPVICRMNVYSEFNSTPHRAGSLNMPADDRQPNIHTTCITGFDDSERLFYARHNRGSDFGHDGYYTVPFDYITKYGKMLLCFTQVDSNTLVETDLSTESNVSVDNIDKPPVIEQPVAFVPSVEVQTDEIIDTCRERKIADIRIVHQERIKNNILAVMRNSGLYGITVLMNNIDVLITSMLNDLRGLI